MLLVFVSVLEHACAQKFLSNVVLQIFQPFDINTAVIRGVGTSPAGPVLAGPLFLECSSA